MYHGAHPTQLIAAALPRLSAFDVRSYMVLVVDICPLSKLVATGLVDRKHFDCISVALYSLLGLRRPSDGNVAIRSEPVMLAMHAATNWLARHFENCSVFLALRWSQYAVSVVQLRRQNGVAVSIYNGSFSTTSIIFCLRPQTCPISPDTFNVQRAS